MSEGFDARYAHFRCRDIRSRPTFSRGLSARMIERPREDLRAVVAFVILLLAGLPIAVWLDLRDITQSALVRQVTDLDRVITGIRSYYADNVVRRVLDTPGHSLVTANYANVRGAIPNPATFSIELGSVVSADQTRLLTASSRITHSSVAHRTFSTRGSAHRSPRFAPTPSRDTIVRS